MWDRYRQDAGRLSEGPTRGSRESRDDAEAVKTSKSSATMSSTLSRERNACTETLSSVPLPVRQAVIIIFPDRERERAAYERYWNPHDNRDSDDDDNIDKASNRKQTQRSLDVAGQTSEQIKDAVRPM